MFSIGGKFPRDYNGGFQAAADYPKISRTEAEPGEVFETFYDREENEIILRRIKKGIAGFAFGGDCPAKLSEPLPKRSREYFRPKI